jgi:tRNA (Thr-GGU) A37 N-methylase
MDPIIYWPIGTIHTPFTELEGVLLQTVAAQGVEGIVEIEPAFQEGLQDLAAFSHVILLTHL